MEKKTLAAPVRMTGLGGVPSGEEGGRPTKIFPSFLVTFDLLPKIQRFVSNALWSMMNCSFAKFRHRLPSILSKFYWSIFNG